MVTVRLIAAVLSASGTLAQWGDPDVKELAAESLERRQRLDGRRQKGHERHRRTAVEERIPADGWGEGVRPRVLKRIRVPDWVAIAAGGGDVAKEGPSEIRARGRAGGKRATALAGIKLGAARTDEGEGVTALADIATGASGKAAKRKKASSKAPSPSKAPSNISSHSGASGKAEKDHGKSEKGSGKSEKRHSDDHSSGDTSSGDHSSGKSGKSESGKAKSGKYAKSRGIDPAESNTCTKRLGIAYDDITALGPEGPFGTIMTPSDVTDLCALVPPEEGEDPNFGCPFLYFPGFGFLEGDDYIDIFGEVPGRAFRSLSLYCECHQGFDLGCAARVPHGPPMSEIEYMAPDGTPREALANGYSEFIPHSDPAERVEYCKMVGVWNGDFDTDVAEDLTEDVMDCGCYFTGQARDMVSQCPGVDLGAFFVFPSDTPSPTPDFADDVTFYDSFEDGTFPGDGWSVETVDLNETEAADSLAAAGINRRMKARLLADVAFDDRRDRNLQGDGALPVWEISTDDAYQGSRSIKSPDLSPFAGVFLSAFAELSTDQGWMTPGWLTFSLRTDFQNSDDGFNRVVWYVDGEVVFGVGDSSDWTTHMVYLGPGPHVVTWEYAHFVEVVDDDVRSAAFIDEVYFTAGTMIPTFSPTEPLPSFSPTTLSPSFSPTPGS